MPMTTSYFSADNMDGAIKSLEKASEILFKRLNDNLMKSNTGKCHLLVNTCNTVKIKTGNFHIISSKREKLLRVKCEHKLSFIIKCNIVYEHFNKTFSYGCVL